MRGWCFGIVAATVVGWLLLNFPIVEFQTPDELLAVDMYSPPELQAAAAESSAELRWKNTLAKFLFLSLCFGGVGVFAGGQRKGLVALSGLLAAVVCGGLAGVLAVVLRDYLNGIVDLPLVSFELRPMVDDMLVFGAISAISVFPAALPWMLSKADHRWQRGFAVVVAGFVGGGLFPFVASIVVKTAGVLETPPDSLMLSAIWMALVGILLIGMAQTAARPKNDKLIASV